MAEDKDRIKVPVQPIPAAPIWDYGDLDRPDPTYSCRTAEEWNAKHANAKYPAKP